MDKNRKMMAAVLLLTAVSVIVALTDVSLRMNSSNKKNITSAKTGPGIGIIRISGPISMSGSGDAFSSVAGAESVIMNLDRMANDPDIRAIVVRIDSPGGTVAATQEIFNKIMKIRNQKKIPIIASMGDLAASGGYYSAAACDYIFANQGTLTGSIGVIIAAPNFAELFKKYGIRMNVIKSGKYKDILSSSREISDEEITLLQTIIDDSYMQFLKDVSLGRNMPIADFSIYADGRVFTGKQALEYKLIDQIGTFEDAIAYAKEKAKLQENAPVYNRITTPFEQILGSLQGLFDITPSSRIFDKRNYSIIEYRYAP